MSSVVQTSHGCLGKFILLYALHALASQLAKARRKSRGTEYAYLPNGLSLQTHQNT